MPTKILQPCDVEQHPQHQGALEEQVTLLISWANRLGLYDAADFVGSIFEPEQTLPPVAACLASHAPGALCPFCGADLRPKPQVGDELKSSHDNWLNVWIVVDRTTLSGGGGFHASMVGDDRKFIFGDNEEDRIWRRLESPEP